MCKYMFLIMLFLTQIFALDLEFKNLSSDFIQEVKSSNSTLKYKGNFIITQNKALWNYTFPNNKQIYINNKEIAIIEHDLEQVIFTSIENLPNLKEIFKNAKKLDNNNYIATYNNIKYEIKINNDMPENIKYKDELNNFVQINFFNQKFNQNINEKIFIPNFPSHFDIVQ